MSDQARREELADLAHHLASREVPAGAAAAEEIASGTSEADLLSELRGLVEEIGNEIADSGDDLQALMARHPLIVASAAFLLGIAVARIFSRGE